MDTKNMDKNALNVLRTYLTATIKAHPTTKESLLPRLREVEDRLQEIAHDAGEPCDADQCEACCGEFAGHEFDDSEGGYCINCGADPH